MNSAAPKPNDSNKIKQNKNEMNFPREIQARFLRMILYF